MCVLLTFLKPLNFRLVQCYSSKCFIQLEKYTSKYYNKEATSYIYSPDDKEFDSNLSTLTSHFDRQQTTVHALPIVTSDTAQRTRREKYKIVGLHVEGKLRPFRWIMGAHLDSILQGKGQFIDSVSIKDLFRR